MGLIGTPPRVSLSRLGGEECTTCAEVKVEVSGILVAPTCHILIYMLVVISNSVFVVGDFEPITLTSCYLKRCTHMKEGWSLDPNTARSIILVLTTTLRQLSNLLSNQAS